jgi:hypothetical protein
MVSSEGLIIGKNSLDKKSLVPFLPQEFDVEEASLINIGTTDVQVVGFTINFGDKLKLVVLAEFIKVNDFDEDLMNGLLDLDLTIAAQATGSADIKVDTKCGGVNLFDEYKTELEDSAAWLAIDKATGNQVSPTSVTAQAGTKSFRITLPTGSYLLSLASVSQLETIGITGYESNEINVQIA